MPPGELWAARGGVFPRTEAELMKNPLGIRIEDVSWTPDAA